MDMVDPKRFLGREAGDPLEDLQWVASQIAVKDPQIDDAPSLTAYGLLRWVRASPGNEASFWERLYVRTLPTGKDLDTRQELQEDGRVPRGLIAALQARANAGRGPGNGG